MLMCFALFTLYFTFERSFAHDRRLEPHSLDTGRLGRIRRATEHEPATNGGLFYAISRNR